MKKLTQYLTLTFSFILCLGILSTSTTTFAAEVKDPFISSYLKISEALASDKKLSEFDLMEFQVKSKDAELKGDALKAVKKFTASKTIKDQRAAFKKVSEAAITYAEKKKIPVYKANCPMAGADWLQAKEAVRNPYYGSSMLACGTSEKL